MTLSVFQRTIVDNSGDTIGGATVEVRRESDGALVPLFSDRDGTAGISNPATAGPDGFLQFYAARGRYRIKATSGSYARTWRDVPLVDLDRVADPISEGARGDGVADDRSPIAKADGIAAAAGKALRFTFGAYLVGSDLTIASDAIFEPGAILKVPTGVTVTFEGAISVGTWQIFDLAGTGAVQLRGDGQPPLNVIWWGAKGDGVTDDAAAIQAAIDEAEAAGGLVVYFPAGTYVVGSKITIDADGVGLVGDGPYRTILQGSFAPGDILHVDGSTATVENILLANFRVASSVSKTSGAGLHLQGMTRSTLTNIVADGQDGNGHLYHAFWFDEVDQIVLDGFQARAQQDGIRVNGATGSGPKAGLFLDHGKVLLSDLGIHCGGAFGGLVVGQVDVINNANGVKISQDIAAQNNREVFFTSSALLDSTTSGPCVNITDAGATEILFTGTWIASANTHGVQVASGVGASKIIFTGCRIFNHKNAGIQIDSAIPIVVVEGGSITDCADGIDASAAISKAKISNTVHFAGITNDEIDRANIRPNAGEIFEVVLADDTAFSFTPNEETGLLYVEDEGDNRYALARYRASSAASGNIDISSNVNFDVTTGALTGITGTDGRATVSAHTDNKVYIENRLGAQQRFRISLQ